MSYKRIFSHSLLYAMGPQIPRVVGFLILPILTRYLNEVDYGIFGTVMAYNGAMTALKMLGFEVHIVNTFYNHKLRWKYKWKQFMGILTVWRTILMIPYVAFIFFLIPAEVEGNRLALTLLVTLPNILFENFNTFGARFFQLSERPGFIAMVTIVGGIATVGLNLYTIAYLQLGYMGWFISIFVSKAILAMFYAPALISQGVYPALNWKLKYVRNILKVSLPTLPHNYSSYLLNSADRVMLDQGRKIPSVASVVTIGGIGMYNFAYIFGNYMEIFGTAIGMAVGPITTKYYAFRDIEKEKELKTFIVVLQTLFLTGCVTVALWMKEIVGIISSNDELDKAYTLGIIVIMGYAYRPMYWAVVNKLFYYEKTHTLWRISFVGGLINIALNVILIPLIGVTGAAYATFVSLMYIGFSGFMLKAYRELRNVRYNAWLWCLGIVLSTGLVYLAKDIAIYYKTIITVVIIVLVFVLYMRNKSLISKFRG